VNSVEGCFVYDIDDLQQVAAQNQSARSREAEAAESIVTKEVARYTDRLAQAPATESIKQLLHDAETLRLQEVARITQQLSGQPLSPEQLAAIDRLTKSLTAKLLHPQIAALRETGSSSESKD
jgi:glutamyl-tRNA reductase